MARSTYFDVGRSANARPGSESDYAQRFQCGNVVKRLIWTGMGAEDALYESPVLRHFVGIDLGRAPVPDESTILQFRHLLERHELGGAMLNTVNQYSGEPRHPHHHGDDRGRDHYSCALVHQEPEWGARSGDAPDAQRKA